MRRTELEWQAVFDELRAIVGERQVLIGEDVSARADDWLSSRPMQAACIVRPAGTGEVAKIVAFCHDHGLVLVPQGGRTGLAGGAITMPGDIALSLERMTGIGEIDRAGSTVVVEGGAVLQAVQEAAEVAGLHYPIDLGARGSATIGGTIATNAGGNSVLRYGMTRDQILGLEAVLADGTVVSSMNHMMKNNAAYDLKHMFVGSEGTLGIVTRAVLRLQPMPGDKATAFIGVASFDAMLDLLALTRAQTDGALASFEVMWPSFYDRVVDGGAHRAPLENRHAYYALVEIASQRSAELVEQVVGEAWESGMIEDAAIAQNGAQGEAFWALRDDVEALLAALKPAQLYDISLPQNCMADYVEQLDTALVKRWPHAILSVFGHVADGNLHLFVGIGEASHEHEIDAMVYAPLKELGGSISAEHGIGLEKRDYLRHSRSPQEIAMMRQVKTMLDPANILNPGKVIPAEAD